MSEKTTPAIPSRLIGMLSDSQENVLFELKKVCLCLQCEPDKLARYNQRGKFVLIPLSDLGNLIQVAVGNGVTVAVE